MKRSITVVLGLLLATVPSRADEITDTVTAAEKTLEEASKTTDAKRKAEKVTEAKDALTKTIDKIKVSKKIYADEEIAPLHQFRGVCNYELREYEQAHEDFTLASKFNPNKITPWLRLSQIKSSAPIEKLRNGKEALVAAENAFKALKLYAAKKPRTAFEEFQQSLSVLELQDEIAIASAAAHAEMGDFKEAIRIIKDGRQEVVKKYLDLYRDGKPYRLPTKQSDADRAKREAEEAAKIRAAEEAKVKAEELAKAEKAAKAREAAAKVAAEAPAKAEAAAAAKLALCKQLIDINKKDAAKFRLQELIRDYPTTKAAEEAKVLLKKL